MHQSAFSEMKTAPDTPVVSTQPVAANLRAMTWEQFQRRYLDRDDRYKYEWVGGTVQKTLRTMDQNQWLISLRLINLLDSLKTSNPGLGKFGQEVDSFFKKAHRRPDLAYFSATQIADIPKGNQTPQFVVEIISNNDQMNRANDKLIDYRRAEVPIVWFVYPKTREVHIYRGKNMTICVDSDPCSAEPVIPDFVLPANQLFG